MKSYNVFLRFGFPLILLCALACVPAYGQDARLQIGNLNKLADKASEVIDVTLDGSILQIASQFLSSKRSADEAKIKELIAGLKGVYVKSFEFDKEGEYSKDDVESIRAQLSGPAWARLVGVMSKKNGEDVEVYVMNSSGKIDGLAVICAEPKELTIVNIVGFIDIEKLRDLEGSFGIPKLDLEIKKSNKEK